MLAPENTIQAERRKTGRHSDLTKVSIRLATDPPEAGDRAWVEDVSEFGLRLHTRRPLSEGDTLLIFEKGRRRPICAIVIWIREAEGRFEVGCWREAEPPIDEPSRGAAIRRLAWFILLILGALTVLSLFMRPQIAQ